MTTAWCAKETNIIFNRASNSIKNCLQFEHIFCFILPKITVSPEVLESGGYFYVYVNLHNSKIGLKGSKFGVQRFHRTKSFLVSPSNLPEFTVLKCSQKYFRSPQNFKRFFKNKSCITFSFFSFITKFCSRFQNIRSLRTYLCQKYLQVKRNSIISDSATLLLFTYSSCVLCSEVSKQFDQNLHINVKKKKCNINDFSSTKGLLLHSKHHTEYKI